jgi:hypothetical protein
VSAFCFCRSKADRLLTASADVGHGTSAVRTKWRFGGATQLPEFGCLSLLVRAQAGNLYEAPGFSSVASAPRLRPLSTTLELLSELQMHGSCEIRSHSCRFSTLFDRPSPRCFLIHFFPVSYLVAAGYCIGCEASVDCDVNSASRMSDPQATQHICAMHLHRLLMLRLHSRA